MIAATERDHTGGIRCDCAQSQRSHCTEVIEFTENDHSSAKSDRSQRARSLCFKVIALLGRDHNRFRSAGLPTRKEVGFLRYRSAPKCLSVRPGETPVRGGSGGVSGAAKQRCRTSHKSVREAQKKNSRALRANAGPQILGATAK